MFNEPKIRVIVVDDEEYICNIIVEALASDSYEIISFTDPAKAIDYIEKNQVDLVLTDLVMGEYSGIQVMETTLRNYEDSVVILMTAHPTIKTAISVLKKGAYDFMVKPFKLEVLKATVRRGLAHQQVIRENLHLKGQVEFLKVANAFGIGVDIEKYLKMVVGSCKTEFSATAVSIMEIDPTNGQVIRKICESDKKEYLKTIQDEQHLLNFTNSRSTKPLIKTEEVQEDNITKLKTFISKPILIRRKLHGTINLLTVRRFKWITPGEMDVLTILTNSAATAIANNKLYNDLQASYLQAIRALANAVEARDKCTKGHTDRVTRLAKMVAEEMDWGPAEIGNLVMGCMLHDIGKIGVPDSILNKPDVLDDGEREKMINHPMVGLQIISGVDLFQPAIPYIMGHHERYDGQGYPKGLKGNDIPIEGRLLAVVDTFDAILSDRPYRKGASLRKAVNELLNNSGSQFDPEIVEVLIKIIRQDKIDFQDMYNREEDISSLDDILLSEKVSV